MLDRHGIPYMLTGSVAASYHGRPRATHDADIVLDPDSKQLDAFVGELEASGFYVDPDGARAALDQRRQFNAIEMQSACKIDLIIRKDRPFSRMELERRRRVDLSFASGVAVTTPEDAILSKLEWARDSGDSERQLRDVASILEFNPGVDRQYIERWASLLDVDALWRRVSSGL
jgi:hypothetical protein